MRLSLPLLASLVLGCLALQPAATAPSTEPADPVLGKVQEALRPVLARSLPGALIRVEGRRLIAEYQIRTFVENAEDVTGDPVGKAVERRGPGRTGMLLIVDVRPGRAGEEDTPEFVPAHVRPEHLSPHWNTEYERYALRDRPETLSLTMLEGYSVSRAVADAIRSAVTSAAPAAPPAPADPTLRGIAARLEAVVRARRPEARVSAWKDGLAVVYHAHTLLVYGHSLTGETQGPPRYELGPNGDGFVLTVNIANGRYEGMAVLPQEFREPYWTTYAEAPEVPGKGQYLSIRSSTAARTDRELMRALREAISP